MEIARELMGHLSQLFAEIEEALKRVPDDLWARKGMEDLMMVPGFLAHHTIWCIRLRHLLNIPEDRLPGNPAPGHYTRANLPSKEQLLGVLEGIRSYCKESYGKMDNEAYLSDRSIGRAMYTIAHTRHHLGQLAQILKEHGINPGKWYPL